MAVLHFWKCLNSIKMALMRWDEGGEESDSAALLLNGAECLRHHRLLGLISRHILFIALPSGAYGTLASSPFAIYITPLTSKLLANFTENKVAYGDNTFMLNFPAQRTTFGTRAASLARPEGNVREHKALQRSRCSCCAVSLTRGYFVTQHTTQWPMVVCFLFLSYGNHSIYQMLISSVKQTLRWKQRAVPILAPCRTAKLCVMERSHHAQHASSSRQ